MNAFSQADAAGTCAVLSQSAESTYTRLDTIMAGAVVGEEAVRSQLRALSASLNQFRHHVDQLGHCLADAPVVHQELGAVLGAALSECQDALAVVSGRLGPGLGGLEVEALSCYKAFLAAQLRFFFFASQLLTIEVEKLQQFKMAHPDARDVWENARKTCQAVSSFQHLTEN
ncbi:hypothetical protein VTK26DRAFT_2947 [Humicola hyalothermophila]